jgi:RsiW-degrading membrane proteinase PrsW (M82 family)
MTLTPALHMVVTVLAAIPITALTAMVWLLVLRRFIPFYHDKNLTSALRTFFSAGFVSVPIILVFNVTIAPIGYARTFSAVTELWNMVVIVGILEEFSKWIVFAVLMQRLRPLRSPEDGILLAAAVGLAFASVENVLYASTYGLRILWFRSVFNTVGHMTYAALWGFVWSAVTWESGGRISHREVPVAGAAVIAVAILHGLYNSSLYLGVAIGLGVKFIILLLSIAAYQHLVDHSPYRTYPRRSARRAIVELRTALRHNPRSVILRRRLGMHQLRLRDYAAAEQSFRRAHLQGGGTSVALVFLIELASYGQRRTEEGTRRLRVMFAGLPDPVRHALRRQLPETLGNDTVLNAIVRGVMGVPRRWAREYRPAEERRRAATARTIESAAATRTAPRRRGGRPVGDGQPPTISPVQTATG